MGQSTAMQILEFWFADVGNGFDVQQQNRLWYSASAVFDQEIHERFGIWVEQALGNSLEKWTETAQGTLALIILLDQFPRNIYRASSKAFAGDEQARQIVQAGLARKFDTQLTFVQRCFFYMPLEHSESLSDQQQCVELFERLLQEVPEQGKDVIASNLRYAVLHRDIIERFGRFVHRNEVLGRASTAQELDYLQSGGERFGQ